MALFGHPTCTDECPLSCEDASFRVHLIPDMAAKVERIDKSQHRDN
jgi:hypothetical protein